MNFQSSERNVNVVENNESTGRESNIFHCHARSTKVRVDVLPPDPGDAGLVQVAAPRLRQQVPADVRPRQQPEPDEAAAALAAAPAKLRFLGEQHGQRQRRRRHRLQRPRTHGQLRGAHSAAPADAAHAAHHVVLGAGHANTVVADAATDSELDARSAQPAAVVHVAQLGQRQRQRKRRARAYGHSCPAASQRFRC